MQNQYHQNSAIDKMYHRFYKLERELDDLQHEISQSQKRLASQERQSDGEFQKWQQQQIANSTGRDAYSQMIAKNKTQAEAERLAAAAPKAPPKTYEQLETERREHFEQLLGFDPREVGQR